MAESNKDKFILLISHGHDDHCDDDYLKLFPSEIKVVIPKFNSPGLRKRVEKAGLKNIIEVEQDVIKVTCSICCATIGMKKEKK